MAQAAVIAQLVQAGRDAPMHEPRTPFAYPTSAAATAGPGGDAAPSYLQPPAAAAAAATGVHASAAVTDWSSIMMSDWLDEYVRERSGFESVSLFCEIKLRELLEVTKQPNHEGTQHDEKSRPVAGGHIAIMHRSRCHTV